MKRETCKTETVLDFLGRVRCERCGFWILLLLDFRSVRITHLSVQSVNLVLDAALGRLRVGCVEIRAIPLQGRIFSPFPVALYLTMNATVPGGWATTNNESKKRCTVVSA